MADRVDKVLTDYFTGRLNLQIRMRIKTLQIREHIDENIGGGRAQNKHSNSVEAKMITEENDYELRRLRHNKEVIETWLHEMEGIRYNVIRDMYLRKKTWDGISMQYGVSRTTMNEWRNEFKKSVEGWGVIG